MAFIFYKCVMEECGSAPYHAAWCGDAWDTVFEMFWMQVAIFCLMQWSMRSESWLRERAFEGEL